MTISTIKKLLSSNDINVIKICQEFIDEKSEIERLRGEAAERRANIILSTLGASSAFLVFIASNFFNNSIKVDWILIVLYSFTSLWLFKSVWYCIKSIRSQSRFRLTEETIFEIQDKSEIEAAKELLSGKIWEYQCSIQPNTERHYYVQRAQRALLFFIVTLLILGVVIILQKYLSFQINTCFIWIFILISLFLYFFGDYLIEKAGIWNH